MPSSRRLRTPRLWVAGLTAAVIMTRHVTDPVPGVREANPKISISAERIVMKLMQKKPEDRYPNAMALAKDIDRVLKGNTIGEDEKVSANQAQLHGNGADQEHLQRVGSSRHNSVTRAFRIKQPADDLMKILAVVAAIVVLAGAFYILFVSKRKSMEPVPPSRNSTP